MLSAFTGTATASTLSQTRQQAAQARAQIDALDAKLAKTVSEYDSASARVARLEQAASAKSAELDRLVARLDVLQQRLDSRAADMYRSGPYAFVEVLAGTTSFDQFVSTWDILTELSRQDAATIEDVRKARVAAVDSARALQVQQSAASAELRAIDGARASAGTQLAQRKRLLASYQGRITALEAEQAAKAAAIARAATAPTPAGGARAGSSNAPATTGSSRPAPDPFAGVTGSGAWKSAIASWFGPGSYGDHMANGQVLRPDSMVVAHKTLPFGTLVEFRYRGRQGVAAVADRGPFVPGRAFDLGPGIARVLGFDGVATIQYRIIGR